MEQPISQHKVSISWISKTGRKLSLQLSMVAFLIFCVWYVVDLPAKYAPLEFSIPYYFDFLPRWLLKIFAVGIALAVVSFFLYDIRRNTVGQLKIYGSGVVLESKNRCDIIKYDELKRITFIVLHFSFNPYRIEFIYPDFKVNRIKVNKYKFYQIMDELHEATPEGFEIDVNSFETIHKISG